MCDGGELKLHAKHAGMDVRLSSVLVKLFNFYVIWHDERILHVGLWDIFMGAMQFVCVNLGHGIFNFVVLFTSAGDQLYKLTTQRSMD